MSKPKAPPRFAFMHCEVCNLVWDHDGFIEEDRLVPCPECSSMTMSDYSLPQRHAADEAC